MDNLTQQVSKYIADNPKIVLIIIVVLIILVIWFYLKSKNIISGFSSKKDKLKKNKLKTNKIIESDEEENNEEDVKKNTSDPEVAQLVKDINENS